MRVLVGREVMFTKPSWTPGTARRIASVWFWSMLLRVEGTGHMAKEQKLRAFTSRLWRSQGCFLSVVVSSMGSVLEKDGSSCERICQTWSLLSRPWLWEWELVSDGKLSYEKDRT